MHPTGITLLALTPFIGGMFYGIGYTISEYILNPSWRAGTKDEETKMKRRIAKLSGALTPILILGFVLLFFRISIDPLFSGMFALLNVLVSLLITGCQLGTIPRFIFWIDEIVQTEGRCLKKKAKLSETAAPTSTASSNAAPTSNPDTNNWQKQWLLMTDLERARAIELMSACRQFSEELTRDLESWDDRRNRLACVKVHVAGLADQQIDPALLEPLVATIHQREAAIADTARVITTMCQSAKESADELRELVSVERKDPSSVLADLETSMRRVEVLVAKDPSKSHNTL